MQLLRTVIWITWTFLGIRSVQRTLLLVLVAIMLLVSSALPSFAITAPATG